MSLSRAPLGEQETDYKALYFELLYQVGNKYPGESRHETALRYIRLAEQGSKDAASAAPLVPPPQERDKL